MKGFVWISLLLGFILIAQGVPVDEQGTDADEYQDDQDGESDDEETAGPPPILRSKNRTFSVATGESVMLPCQVDNPENGVIIWWMGANIIYTGNVGTIQAKERPNIELLKNNSLSITKIQPEDLGKYACEVIDTNTRGKSTVHYFVGITAKPQITMMSPSLPRNTVQKGSSITLTCSATGTPPPKISFTKKTKHGSHEEQFEGPTLTLDNVNRKNSGIYQCKAENDAGVDSKTIELHVTYKPEVEAVKKYVNTDEGEDTELLCIVHSEPKAEVEWYKDYTKIENDHPVLQLNDKRKHSLKLHGIKAEDFGTYKCAATNTLGTSSESIELSGRPTKPIFQSASASSDGKSPQLSWKVESISPISEYELLYKMQDAATDWKTAYPLLEKSHGGVYMVRHVLSGLQSHSYQAQLRAKNNYGWSPLSEPHTFSGNIETPKDEPSAQEPLESEQKDETRENAASELRISFALILSILIARFYC